MEERPKMKPSFSMYERLTVSDKYSYWTEESSRHTDFLEFFKYNRKFSNEIRIDGTSYYDEDKINKALFIRASKRLRSKHMRELSTNLFWNPVNKDQAYKIVKNFSNIKTLSLTHPNNLSSAQRNCKEWLRRAKCLKKMSVHLFTNAENGWEGKDISESFIKLARTFKKGRLHELVLDGDCEELFTMHAHHFPKVRLLRFEGNSYTEERRGPIKYIEWNFSYQETAEHLIQPNDDWGEQNNEDDWEWPDQPVVEYKEIKPEDWERVKNEEYYNKIKKDLETTIKHFKLCWRYENHETTTCAPTLLKEIRDQWQSFSRVVRLPSNFNLQDHNLQVKVPCYQSSLNEAHNLTALTIDYVNQPQRILQILQSFPDLPNLITLSVRSCKNSSQQECPLLYPLLEAPRNLTTLTLNLENCIGAFKYLEDFPKNHSLREFILVVPITEEAHLEILSGIVSHLQNAETLDIWSPKCTVSSTSREFYNLFDKAFALPKLQRLGLSFEWLHRIGSVLDYADPQDGNLVDYKSFIKNLFTKEISLEEFCFEFPLKHSSLRKAFLFEILELGLNLKELRLGVGDVNFDELEASQVLTLLQRMNKLEVLRLYDFVISSNRSMGELADTVSLMRSLERLQLHSLSQDVDLFVFATFLPKILVKINLKEVSFLIPKDSDTDFIVRVIKTTKIYEDHQTRLDFDRLKDFLRGHSLSYSIY